jgi:hypothetical protein
MTKLPALALVAGAALMASACTYVERERPATPAQPTTVYVPAPQQPTVVTPAPAPTVTVRPSY